MAGFTKKNFDDPEELRTPPKTRIAVVDLAGAKVARLSLEPGWRWSEAIKPVVGGELCQARHLGIVASGTLHVLAADGSEVDLGPGAAYVIEPGHDAWVVGDAPVTAYEFESPTASTFAVPTS